MLDIDDYVDNMIDKFLDGNTYMGKITDRTCIGIFNVRMVELLSIIRSLDEEVFIKTLETWRKRDE